MSWLYLVFWMFLSARIEADLLNGGDFTKVLETLSQDYLGIQDIQVNYVSLIAMAIECQGGWGSSKRH